MDVKTIKKILTLRLELSGDEANALLNCLHYCKDRISKRGPIGPVYNDMLACCEVLGCALENELKEGFTSER